MDGAKLDEAERAGDGREETPLERVDRNLAEITGELRVVITGIQVLFGFLLVVPFDSGFRGIGSLERDIYFVTLAFAALAAICMIAPSAAHRVLFRRNEKRHIVAAANRQALAGLVCLAIAMCGSLMLVATKLFGAVAGIATLASAALVFGTVWFAVPLRRRRAARSRPPRRPAGAAEGR